MTHSQLAGVDDPFGSPDAMAFLDGFDGFDGLDFGLDFGGDGLDLLMLPPGDGGAAGGSAAGTSPNTSGCGKVAPPWRCLDSGHPPGCTRCMPPPSADQAARYELVGDPGKRNGEKKLRSLLTCTPEWTSADVRAAAAEQLQGRFPRLATSLRSRTSSSLSKEHMVALLALWGYRSNLWVRRGNRPKRAAPGRAAAPAATAGAEAQATWAATQEVLQPLSEASFAGVTGLVARAEAERRAESAIAYERELPPLRVIVGHLRDKWMPFTSSMLALALQGSHGVASERCAACLVQILARGARIYAALEHRSRAQLADPACGPAQSLWLKEMLEGQQAQVRIFQVLTEFVGRPVAAEQRSARTVAVVKFLTLHITGIVGGFDARIAWVTRQAEKAKAAGGAGDTGGLLTPMFDTALPLQTLPPAELLGHDADV